ncbi:MAG TPA: hypothetical protein PLJ39_13890 [Spirochaetota bacterium]|nr:hypothetical protein [Spirochaetota bacterium]
MKKYMYLALMQIIIMPVMFPLNSDDSYFNYADSVWSKNNDIVNDALKKSMLFKIKKEIIIYNYNDVSDDCLMKVSKVDNLKHLTPGIYVIKDKDIENIFEIINVSGKIQIGVWFNNNADETTGYCVYWNTGLSYPYVGCKIVRSKNISIIQYYSTDNENLMDRYVVCEKNNETDDYTLFKLNEINGNFEKILEISVFRKRLYKSIVFYKKYYDYSEWPYERMCISFDENVSLNVDKIFKEKKPLKIKLLDINRNHDTGKINAAGYEIDGK